MLGAHTRSTAWLRAAVGWLLVGTCMVRSENCLYMSIQGPYNGLRVVAGDPIRIAVQVFYDWPEALHYQWLKDGVLLADTTDPVYTKPAALHRDAGVYRCIVTDTTAGCADTSCPITLGVLRPADLAPTTDTHPFYTFDLLGDTAGASCSFSYVPSMAGYFTDSLNKSDYLVDAAHSPDGKPFVMNLRRQHAALFSGCSGDPVPIPNLAAFRVNASSPRHASALYLAANTSGVGDSGKVGEVRVSFRRPAGDVVEFTYSLVHRWDLRNWWAGADTSLPVAPLDSNPNRHRLAAAVRGA